MCGWKKVVRMLGDLELGLGWVGVWGLERLLLVSSWEENWVVLEYACVSLGSFSWFGGVMWSPFSRASRDSSSTCSDFGRKLRRGSMAAFRDTWKRAAKTR